MWIQAILLALPLALVGNRTLDEGIRRVRAHLLIDDPTSALQEAKLLEQLYPDSREAGAILVEALSHSGLQTAALEQWRKLTVTDPNALANRQLLEEIGWGILKKELGSTQYAVRLAALIGSYLTHDVRAIPILLKMMRDSNAVIRCVAVQMASAFGDAPLKDEIAKMMAQEKVWIVRMEVIQAAGRLRMHKMIPKLEALLRSDKTMVEERHVAIEALIHMSDNIKPEEIERLARSNRAGLRHLACAIATHFEVKESKDAILLLLGDTHPDVKVAALNALGLFYRHLLEPDEIANLLKPLLKETNPQVAITSAWVATLVQGDAGVTQFTPWIQHSIAENRRFAASALAATGKQGIRLASVVLQKSDDPYVRANVALGLIGQREEVPAAANCLYTFLSTEKRMWMWDNRMNPLFQTLSPSHVRHIDQIPNYPEAIDQMTRLNLVSILAMVEDPRTIDALKQFLQLKKWNITGVAAATLLQEGDETSLEIVRQLIDDENPQVRLQACLVLALYGKDPTVLKELQNAYAGADFEMKLHILEALGSVGNQDSFHFLIQTLEEPFPLLRVAAAAALIQSINR
jgi:HEAT repeat protein